MYLKLFEAFTYSSHLVLTDSHVKHYYSHILDKETDKGEFKMTCIWLVATRVRSKQT